MTDQLPNIRKYLDPRESILDRVLPKWEIYWPRPARVRILVVVENRVPPGPPGSGFGLGRVVSYLRGESFGFVNFDIDFAQYGTTPSPTAIDVTASPGPWDYKYTDFRLDSTVGGTRVIDNYEQVWFFGTEPFIHDDGTNDVVTSSPYSPTNTEVAAFSAWMDAGGGVLAMGDHNFLGAAMCWKIPRVGTMRAWLKDTLDAKSVPNRTGTDRHDTNQPMNAAQDPNLDPTPDLIPTFAEEDAVTQPLEWKRYPVWSLLHWQRRNRPHPVLCGGSLGVIDRFPDHPHEGLVIHEDQIDFARKCTHDDTKDEYPTVSGQQPRSEVVAWVHPLPSPPYRHQKLEQPARRIPAIGVYDGHSIALGRVLVDSTWHHWFDMNVAGLEAANTTDFQKIRRYFENVPIWLSTPAAQRRMLAYGAFWTMLHPAALENLTLDTHILTLGGQALDILGRRTSDCLVTSWLIDRLDLRVREILRKPPIGPEPCWSCPPEDLFTQAILGGVIRRMLPLRDELLKNAWSAKGRAAKVPYDPERIDALVEEGVRDGFEAVLASMKKNHAGFEKSMEVTQAALAQLGKGHDKTAC